MALLKPKEFHKRIYNWCSPELLTIPVASNYLNGNRDLFAVTKFSVCKQYIHMYVYNINSWRLLFPGIKRPCNRLKANWCFGGTCISLFVSCWLLAWFIFQLWRWRRYFPPKFLFTFNGRIPSDRDLHNHRFDNLISYTLIQNIICLQFNLPMLSASQIKLRQILGRLNKLKTWKDA